MLIECPYCEAKVDAKVLAEHEYPTTDDTYPIKNKLVLLECPGGNCPLLGRSYHYGSFNPKGEVWNHPELVYPEPDEALPRVVPPLVRASLDDARKCFKAALGVRLVAQAVHA